ncbi:probable lipoprotein NlpC [Marinobacter sp. DSM 26671]|jgi:lipoprotein Spr/probable lipoprotein NlpC|nr:probable lipoprotein NlpC [Marinobacter sp. DSM 26671]|tara:strand:+ start:1513 stop:2124 length:612 start_codon:yes stop_codon:yes gene_type:complete
MPGDFVEPHQQNLTLRNLTFPGATIKVKTVKTCTGSEMRYSFRNVLFLAFVALALGGCASSGKLQSGSTPGLQTVPVEASSSEKAQKLWQVFERYRGTPYEYGGTSGNGFDCSGFILTAYQEGLGKQLPRTTTQMLASGDVVHPGEIRPGDVVFFRIGGKEQHAGIYMGGDRFIHASTSAGVIQSSISGYYWKGRLTEARRFD